MRNFNLTTLRQRIRQEADQEDTGSLLLALLFALMVSALIVVATTTIVAGLNKTASSREAVSCQQAADSAASDALLALNRGSSTTTQTETNSFVDYTWTLTNVNTTTRTIDISCTGATVSRNFTGTYTGLRVDGGYKDNGYIYYTTDRGSSQIVWYLTQQPTLRG